MRTPPDITRRIIDGKVIAIVRTSSLDDAVRAAKAVIDGGVTTVEVTLTTPGALEAIHELARTRSSALVGAGTVLDATSARMAMAAGARFLVCPAVIDDVITTGHESGAVVVPGAQTATEILRALNAGASLVKLFPASTVGIGHLRALLTPLPHAALVPTGGITVEAARAWLDAGAAALGIGGSLTAGEPAEITSRARRLTEALAYSSPVERSAADARRASHTHEEPERCEPDLGAGTS